MSVVGTQLWRVICICRTQGKTKQKEQSGSLVFKLSSTELTKASYLSYYSLSLFHFIVFTLSMASTFLTFPIPLLANKPSSPFHSQQRFSGLRRNSLKVNAMAKWEPTKIVPQADRVLVRLEELPEKSSGGVLLPKSAVKFERYLVGEVLSVGAEVGVVETGKKVLFSDINAYEVDLGTEGKHCFCKAGDLLAVVE